MMQRLKTTYGKRQDLIFFPMEPKCLKLMLAIQDLQTKQEQARSLVQVPVSDSEQQIVDRLSLLQIPSLKITY